MGQFPNNNDGPFHCGGEKFDWCPTSYSIKFPAHLDLFMLYVDCCSGVIGDGYKNLPFSGGVFDQPRELMKILRTINSAAHAAMRAKKENA